MVQGESVIRVSGGEKLATSYRALHARDVEHSLLSESNLCADGRNVEFIRKK